MARRWWLIPIAGIAGALLYRELHRGGLRRMAGRLDTGNMGNPAAYDIFSSVMDGLYTKIALEVVDARPVRHVLDVGCGPGRLDVRLAAMVPSLEVTGVDLDPRMVKRAVAHAVDAGLSGRVHFEVGDSAALLFGDNEFDLAVSTLSLHHWANPLRGLSEIHRVLKPGGEVRVYDVPDQFRQFLHGGDTMLEMAGASPFGFGVVDVFRWPGPVPSLQRLRLHKAR